MKYSKVKAYKYKLEETEANIVMLPNCEGNGYVRITEEYLMIQKGYLWDGSSIPGKKWLQRLSLGFYDPDKYCKDASLKHDALCQLMREGLLDRKHKEHIDRMYRNDCVLGGMSNRQADNRYKKLRKYGDPYILPEKNPRNKIYDTDPKGAREQ